jgi:hypothetical protein
MSNIVERLRDRAFSSKFPDEILEEAAAEIERLRDLRDTWHLVRSKLEKQIKFLEDGSQEETERLRQERNHWMAAARAFDDHLATMRVMMMEHPTVRFSEPRY